MPKVTGTRKQRAEELLQRLRRGPMFSNVTRRDGLIEEREVQSQYRGWSQSWVLTEVCQLVPELRGHLDSLGYFRADAEPPSDEA